MSRFGVTTIATLASGIAVALSLRGAACWWALGAIALAYLMVLAIGVTYIRARFFCEAFCRGERSRWRVALTFDDGPDPGATPRLLDLLREQRVPATFFCVGEKVAAHPEVVQRMVAEGHVIGNHTYRHSPSTNFLAAGGLRREIERAQEALCQVAGRLPRYFRSPVGLTNPHFPAVLKQLGLIFVGWDVRSLDRGAAPGAVVARVCRQVRAGSIVLLHDGGGDADLLVAMVSRIISQLKERDYAFVTLEDMGAGPAYRDG